MSKKSGKRKSASGQEPEMHGSGRTAAPWSKEQGIFEGPPLKGAVEADVCVVGGGFAGLTAAYQLASAGKSVVVLEDGAIASGESGRSTAHLSNVLRESYARLQVMHGEAGARLINESHSAAVDFIERVVAEEKLDCGFSRLNGYLILASDQPLSLLDEELKACQRAGVFGVEKIQGAPVEFWNTGPCLAFPRQGQLDPVRYLSGLARAAHRLGVKIHTRNHAQLQRGKPLRVRTEGGVVVAGSVILATNAPVDDMISISARQAAYRTYAICAPIPIGSGPQALFWDSVDPYHYVRISGDLLIVGGEDHKVAHAFDAAQRWEKLEAWTRARFPMFGAVARRWSGQIQESADGVGLIGRTPGGPEGVFIVTGDSGNGTTNGTLGGMLLADLILGRANAWESVYDPGRVPKAPYTLASEALDSAAQYLRYAAPGEVGSVDQIPPGSGAIIKRGLTPAAVYRALDGSLSERSAVCPHLGGLLCWNGGEGTWDCPVHGSRFSAHGEPVNGPANEPLEEIESPPPNNPIIEEWKHPPAP